MALQTLNFAGFESSRDYEVDVQSGSVSILTTPAPPQSNESYVMKLVGASPVTKVAIDTTFDFTTNNRVTMGMYIQIEEDAPSADVLFLEIEGSAKINLELYYTTTGAIRVKDSSGATSGTSTTTLVKNTWYLLEFEWLAGNAGNIEIFLDGTSILNVSGDFERVGQSFAKVRFVGSTAAQELFIASFYHLNGTTMPTRYGPYEILIYAYDEATAVPNIGGDNLELSTTWDQSAEKTGNDSNASKYDTVGNKGIVETSYGGGSYTAGPKDDTRVGTIKAASWLFRHAIVGFGTSGNLWYGSGVGPTDGTVSTSATGLTSKTVYDNGSLMPTTGEYFQYGFELLGGLRFDLREVWCNLLHQPPVIVSPSSLPVSVVVQAPTVALSISVTPSALTIPFSVVAPSVLLGAVSTQPATLVVGTSVLAPSVSLGAVVVTPAAATVSLVSQSVGLVMGGVTAPAATQAVSLSLQAPIVSSGGVVAPPTVLLISVSALTPSVTVGAVTVTPQTLIMFEGALRAGVLAGGVSRAATTVSVPIVMQQQAEVTTGGPQTALPAAVSLPLTVLQPTVSLGGVVRSAITLSAAFSEVAPSVVLGAVSVSPVATSVNVTLVSPTVGIGAVSRAATLLPIPVTTLTHSIVLGGVTHNDGKATEVRFLSKPPSIVTGSAPQVVALSTLSVPVSVVAPSISLGGVSRSAPLNLVAVSAVTPAFIQGAVTEAPQPIGVQASVLAPSVSVGGVVRSAGTQVVQTATVSPNVVLTRSIPILLTKFATVVLGPSVQTGAVSRAATSVAATVAVQAPTEVLGGVSRVAAEVAASISVATPATFGGGQAVSASTLALPVSVVSPVILSGGGVYFYRLVRKRRRRT